VRDRVHRLLAEAAQRVVEEIDPAALPGLEEIALTPSKSPEHGDFASNIALMLAKPLGRPPRELADRIADALREAAAADGDGIVDRVEVAGPGFLNVFVVGEGWHDLLGRILRDGAAFGLSNTAGGLRVMVEFVSANPTGPLTIGHGRNAVLGDCVCRLLAATGHKVTREYYFNDGGRQMRVLGASLRARYEQALGRDAELPEDGYRGEYLAEIARALAAERGEALLEAPDEDFSEAAQRAIFANIRNTIDGLGIHFDVYYNERSLYDEGRVEAVLGDLRGIDLVFEADGAVWMRAEPLGLDRDRVLVRTSGDPTYLLPDIAYHREKFRRGFECIIDVLGPDHIEQFPYVRAAVGALGHDTSGLEVLLYQWVNLRRDGELLKMSTRAASFVTVDELLADVGVDVFRWFMIDRRADTHLDFDVDLARERSDRNPVYKVQYAHARLCSIERLGGERGLELPTGTPPELRSLELPEELELAKRLGRWPEVVAHAAAGREPQEVARYLLDLASAFNTYVSDGRRHRILGDDAELSLARLALARCVRTVLANGLGLLGISAPERM
jgi:arginyl-tRNA synthetase